MTENDVKAGLRVVLKRNNNHGIYVFGIDKSESGESCCFSAVIQDVERFSDLDPLSIRRQLSWGEIGHVTVNFIEVSFDVFCNDPAEQGARFYRDLINPVSNNRRLYRNGKGTPKQIPHDINEIKSHLLAPFVNRRQLASMERGSVPLRGSLPIAARQGLLGRGYATSRNGAVPALRAARYLGQWPGHPCSPLVISC